MLSNQLASSSTDDQRDVDDSLADTMTYLTDIAAAAKSAQTAVLVEDTILTLRRRLYNVRAFLLSSAESTVCIYLLAQLAHVIHACMPALAQFLMILAAIINLNKYMSCLLTYRKAFHRHSASHIYIYHYYSSHYGIYDI